MKLTDLHNHTTYSYDGQNSIEEIIKNAISHSIDVVGICDHQFSINEKLPIYIEEVNFYKEKYKDKIEVKCGLEIGTRPNPNNLILSYINMLDYCLFESIDSLCAMDLYEFLEWTRLFKIKKGLAHTDIFSLSDRYQVDMIKIMKEYDLFFEINTSGNYNYYYDFITNPRKQQLISDEKLPLSLGSDTHWIRDFNINKLKSCAELLEKLKNPIIFS